METSRVGGKSFFELRLRKEITKFGQRSINFTFVYLALARVATKVQATIPHFRGARFSPANQTILRNFPMSNQRVTILFAIEAIQ